MSAAAQARTTGALTRELAARAAATDHARLPADVIEVARHCLIDWFGVTLGGAREPSPSIAFDAVQAGSAPRTQGCSVIGRAELLAPLDAALVNGTASHVLDFDDVNMTFLGHASVAVLGAALALAEQLDADGAALIAAFVAGYETACRIAAALGPQPYMRGWHSTGTVGTFGAAAACARLLGLDPERTAVALALAASEAAGIKSNLGTMAKSLHAGRACAAGLLAAQLAARGFTANTSSIEAEQGFAALAGGDCDIDAALADPPAGWHIRDNLFKYHAACFFTHSTLEGVARMRREDSVDAATLERLELHVSELELGACAIPAPRTGLEVKFSIAHLAAMAMLERPTAVIADSDAVDPDVIAVRERIELVGDGAAGRPTLLRALRRDGASVEAAEDVNAPLRDHALQLDRLSAKFATLADPVLGRARAGRLRDALAALDGHTRVPRLMVLARPPA
ncbi:MAG TPA: MmgE/PrpD family protein [Solirubrobacteraceae bacterium]|jgi:2-methylcitrate dehydratase PrpD|nr:MmgE/PrpD family protein [Solirubrobacteraceae bacterium]